MVHVVERVTQMEGDVARHAQLMADLRAGMSQLERRMDHGFDHVDSRFTLVEGRLNALDQKLDMKIGAIDQKLDTRTGALDQKLDMKTGALDRKIDQRFDEADRKLSSSVRWLVGVQVTVFLGLLAAILAR